VKARWAGFEPEEVAVNGFHAGEVALEIGARIQPVVQRIRAHDGELAMLWTLERAAAPRS